MLNYAAPPSPTSQGAGVAAAGRQAWQWLQDQRAESTRQGLLDPDTGLPTQKGLIQGVGQTAQGVMMGTTAPGDVPPPGIVAYHGSPADFNRFDDRFIGTGEGAQAYGRGLYFAEGEGVARQYRDVLASRSETDTPEGVAKFWANMQGGHEGGISHLEFVQRQIDQYPNNYPPGEADKINQAIQYLKSGGDLKPAGGHMYQVNIGADPEHFLDWDKPLSEQHPAVQSLVPQVPDGVTRLPNGRWGTTLNGNVIGRPDGWPDMSTAQYVSKTMRDDLGNTSNWTGSDLHSYLAKNNPGAPAAPAEQMQAAGIPGIRYLDQGSRGAGQGTHNYVVFDPATIEILRKYGLAGLIAGGGAAAAGTQQQQPSQ
jgi:hypothetical protein